MMTADALASIDIALILAFIFLRSRSTRERLPSASDEIAAGLLLDARSTMPKKLASAAACARYSLLAGVGRAVMPMVCVSTIARNSLLIGSGKFLGDDRSSRAAAGRP